MAMEVAPLQIDTSTNNDFEEALELEHLIGMTCNYTNSFIIHPIDSNKYIYSIGPTIIVNEFDNKHNQISLKNHDSAISCINISNCGTMIASGQYGSNLLKNTAIVNLYDFNKLSLIHSFSGLLNKVKNVIFSDDSKFLIGIDLNGLFIIWDTKTFETIFAKQIILDKEIINIDCISILNVINDKNICKHNIYKILISYQYNLYQWTLIYSLKHMEYILSSSQKFSFPPNRTFNRILTHLTKIEKIDDSSDNNFLISATTNIGEIYLFDAKHNVYIDSFQVCCRGANISCFIDINNLIIGGGDGTIKQYRFDNKIKEWQFLKGIKLDSSINTFQLNLENNILFATTIQSNVYKIKIDIYSNFEYNLIFQAPFSSISKIVFGKKYNHIFATLTYLNAILTIWDLSNYLSFAEIKNNGNGNGTALSSIYENDIILTGFENGTIICNQIDFKQNGKNGKNKILQIWQIKNAHRGKVNCVILCESQKQMLLLSGGDDGLLNIWNYNTKQLISTYHIQIEYIMNIIIDIEYDEIIHLLGSNGQITSFSLKREGIIIRRMVKNNKNNKNNSNFGKLTCLIQSNYDDEYELITSTSNGYILIWDPKLTQLIESINCKKIIKNENLQILSIALSNNSKYLCCGNNMGQIFILSMKNNNKYKLITINDIHSNGITSIVWTPDDKQIITSSIDSSIAISNFYT